MTLLDERPALWSSTSTTPRVFLRRNRWWIALAVVVVGALVLVTLLNGVGRSGTADPDSYEPSGARALATLLRDQGVTVTRTTDVGTTVTGVTENSTIFVPQPFLLTEAEISDLQGAGAHLVIATADPGTVSVMGLDALPEEALDEERREPGCGFAPAEAAGTARIGGFRYGDGARNATSCYDGVLLSLPDQDVVLLGATKPLSNERLDEDGNAALGLGLLGAHDDLRWFMPAPDRVISGGEAPARSIGDLMPAWVDWAILQLLVVVVLLMLWRGRRLGRVVPEPLPVVVRAAETVEGRGRLYRIADARPLAAEALRSGARDRLARRLGAGRNAAPELLVDLVAARTSRPAPEVSALLYGPPPVDDDALVRLAHALDALTLEVSGS